MASRSISSVCHFCEAARVSSRTRSFRPSLSARRLLSTAAAQQRPLSHATRDIVSKSTARPLPYLILRTNYRRYAHTSAEKDPAQAPTAETTTIIEATGGSVYTSNDIRDLEKLMAAIDRNLFKEAAKVLPREEQVIDALSALQRYALKLKSTESSRSAASHMTEGSASAILSFAGSSSTATEPDSQATSTKQIGKGGKALSSTTQAQIEAKENPPIHPVMDVAYNILSHPSVFISPDVLSAYVSLAATVRDPSTIPSMFRKYANKPILSSPDAKPSKPNPNAAKFSIPLDTAKAALEVAIAARNLPKALEIVDTSVGAKAFLRRKTMTQVVPFWTLCGVVPVGLWKIASWLATYDNNFLHSTATGWAFTLLCCYTVYTGTIGMTALLTYNDHMLRVTWIPGFPLRERWYMEEQRRMADKVAMAWGFQNAQEWGLESGWEWQYLRHWCGVRGMIVDDSTVLEAKEIRIGGH